MMTIADDVHGSHHTGYRHPREARVLLERACLHESGSFIRGTRKARILPIIVTKLA
jgi:hypothetical protein